MKTSSILSLTLIWVIFISLFTACKDEAEVIPINTNPYKNCCGTEPLEAMLSIGKMYVPNIMIANKDDIGNASYGISVFTNRFITNIDSFTISINDEIIFETLNNAPSPFANYLWDGTDHLGNQIEGLVDLKFKATAFTGLSGVFTTQVCVYPCGQEGFPIENLGNCGFSSQDDYEGGFDPDSPPPHEDCF